MRPEEVEIGPRQQRCLAIHFAARYLSDISMRARVWEDFSKRKKTPLRVLIGAGRETGCAAQK